MIKHIHSDNGGEYFNNELKDFFLTRGVIHTLTLLYSPETNGIVACFKQTIYMKACSMTIVTPDFLDFRGYVITLLFITDIHFIFHNFFISYATYVRDSREILCFCLCILTVLSILIII
jgi:transposase InsO family protein